MEEIAEVVDPFNRTEPRALINIVPEVVGESILTAHQKNPEWFGLAEQELWRALRKECQLPNPSDNRLRMKFWMEYDLAQAENRKMRMNVVVAGVCTPTYFWQNYLKVASKVAWLLTPPANYLVVAEEALQCGLERLREIFDVSPVKGQGDNMYVDTKLAETQLKVVAMLDQRVKGAIIQKTMNLHSTVTDKKIAEITGEKSMDILNARLEALEKRRRNIQNKIDDPRAVKFEQAIPAESKPVDSGVLK